MADPISITTSALALVGVVLKVSITAIGMVDKTTGAHEAARDALRNLRRALQNLNKGTSNIQTILHILISDSKDKAVKKLLALPAGELAVKELCESLETTRGLLAERAGKAQRETTGLEPLPRDRRSLAFIQAVFKHNFSPSNIEDAIIAFKDFQFEVESCQQTTELAFQQVWRVYDIVKTRTLQRRPSFSAISSISTQIHESSTESQATTSVRGDIVDWLKRQDVTSKSNFETPYSGTQAGRAGTRSGENTLALERQPTPISRDQDLSGNWIGNFFGLSRARQDNKKAEPFHFPLTRPRPIKIVYVGAPPRTYDRSPGTSIQYDDDCSGSIHSDYVESPPRSYDRSPVAGVQYDSDRSDVESHNNGGDGLIHSEKNDKIWARGFFGSSKERDALKEVVRLIGSLVATASDDWLLLLELCERASASESAARETAKALKRVFKYADPPAQYSAAKLWAILLYNSNNYFIIQTAGKKFMDAVESAILSSTNFPVVKERLLEVLAGAAFMGYQPGTEGFQSTWMRVRPRNEPIKGIPLDVMGPMFSFMRAPRPDSRAIGRLRKDSTYPRLSFSL